VYVFEISSLAARLISELSIVIAIIYILLGVDNVVFDAMYWVYAIYRRIKRISYPRPTRAMLFAKPEQRIAIFIACWHESGVIDRMLRRACESIEYSNYDIFVGVYPNDADTVASVLAVAQEHPRVHAVVNPQHGPTTKTQNLNAIYAGMQQHEGDDRYAIIVMHDAEDVIHPLSLRVYNHLIPRKSMVQLPVFPLEVKASSVIAWTYADEFAEHQLKDMILREAMGSFVPSAGVGCGFDRVALESLSTTPGCLFPSKTLTEDYEIGLRLSLAGRSTIHAQILDLEQTGVRRYIATRSHFPATFSAATRQKARWIAGICLQSWQTLGWRGNLLTLYALYRDRRGLIANPITLLGYALSLLLLAFYGLNALDPNIVAPLVNQRVPEVWFAINFVMAMTIFRVLQRAYFVATLYGVGQGLLSIARQPVAAFLNAIATIRATTLFASALFNRQEMRWQKTDHEFPEDAAA
jgi:adsorption protein B